MKKFVIIPTLFILIFFGHLFGIDINAESESIEEGVVVSPPIATVQPGQSFDITVQNTTNENLFLELEEQLFQFSKNKKLVPIEEAPTNEHIEIEVSQIRVEPNNTINIPITYLATPQQNYIAGVSIRSSGELLSNGVAIDYGVSTIFFDTNQESEAVKLISSTSSVKSNLQISRAGLSDTITVKGSVTNNGMYPVFLQSGQTFLFDDSLLLENKSHTQTIPDSLWPEESFEYEFTFKDPRPFWERLGTLSLVQEFEVRKEVINNSTEIYIIPWEIVAITIGIILIGMAGFTINKFKKSKSPVSKGNKLKKLPKNSELKWYQNK